MECIFCKILKGEIPSEKVYEDEYTMAFKDINPQAPVHILIIPREHIENFSELKGKEYINEKITHAVLKIVEKLNLKDYRLVINCGRDAGQAVFHLHWHLLSGRTFSWPPG